MGRQGGGERLQPQGFHVHRKERQGDGGGGRRGLRQILTPLGTAGSNENCER